MFAGVVYDPTEQMDVLDPFVKDRQEGLTTNESILIRSTSQVI